MVEGGSSSSSPGMALVATRISSLSAAASIPTISIILEGHSLEIFEEWSSNIPASATAATDRLFALGHLH